MYVRYLAFIMTFRVRLPELRFMGFLQTPGGMRDWGGGAKQNNYWVRLNVMRKHTMCFENAAGLIQVSNKDNSLLRNWIMVHGYIHTLFVVDSIHT
jgi:hypothetical protein